MTVLKISTTSPEQKCLIDPEPHWNHQVDLFKLQPRDKKNGPNQGSLVWYSGEGYRVILTLFLVISAGFIIFLICKSLGIYFLFLTGVLYTIYYLL